MGFVHDFSSKPMPMGPAPQVTQQPPAQRGFLVDFNPGGAESDVRDVQDVQDVYRPTSPEDVSYPTRPVARPSFTPNTSTEADYFSYSKPSSTRVLKKSSLPSPSSFSQPVTADTVSQPTTDQVSPYEVREVESGLRGLADKVRSLASSGTESKITDLEGEIAGTRQSLYEAKQSLEGRRSHYQRKEQSLERARTAVSRLETRLSGFGSSSASDEYLFSRDELHSINSSGSRKEQMGRVLDRRREKVWSIQDEVSNARAVLTSAEARIGELELRLNRLQGQLEQARNSKQQNQSEKADIESKISHLKDRYYNLTGQFW